LSKENSVTYYVKKYLNKINSEQLSKLTPSGSTPGKLYGMVKVHKTNFPLRPVVSMINTPEYELAKYLDNLIKPYVPK